MLENSDELDSLLMGWLETEDCGRDELDDGDGLWCPIFSCFIDFAPTSATINKTFKLRLKAFIFTCSSLLRLEL